MMPQCMVVNMDTSREAGSHWVALFVHSPLEVDYFDSFADWPPHSEHIRTYLRQFTRVNASDTCLQSDRSAACGKHVIYFLCRRAQGWPLQRIVRHLARCKTHPDRVVSAFARKFIFGEDTA